MKGVRERQLPPPLPKSSPPREGDYEEIDLYRRNLASRPGMSSPPGLPKKGDGRHCDLCGSSTPIVRCDKCNNQLFCLSCDDMYHRHPKRQSHLRKAIQVTLPVRTVENSTRPPLPPKSEHAVPPQPPPRRKPRPPGFVTPMLPRKEMKPSSDVAMTPMTVRKELPIPKPVELSRKVIQTPLSPTTQKKQVKPPSTPSLMRKDFLDKVGSLGRKLMGSVSDLRSPSIARKEIPPPPPPKASQSQLLAPKASPISILKKPPSNVTRTDSGVSLSSYQSDEAKLRGQNQPLESQDEEVLRQQFLQERNGSQQSLVDFTEEQMKLTARQRSCSVAGLWAGTPGTAMPPNGRNFDPQQNFGSLGRRFNGSNSSLSGPPKMSASAWDLAGQQGGFPPLQQAQSMAHVGCTTCAHGWNGGWEHHMHHPPMNYPMQYPWDMGMRRTPSTLSMPGRPGPEMLMPGSWHHPSPMMYPMHPGFMMPQGVPPVQQPADARAPSPANSHRSRNSHKSHRRPTSSTKWRSPDSSDSEDYKSKKSGRSSRHRRQTESSDDIDEMPRRQSVEKERRRERISNDREKPRERMSNDRERSREWDREKLRRESPHHRQKSRESDRASQHEPATSPEAPESWPCGHCTFINDAADKICAICCKSRPNEEKKRRFRRKDEKENSRSRASSLKGSKPASPESSDVSEEENALPVVLSNMSFKISSKATPTVTTTPASPVKDNGPARSPLDDAQNRPNSTTRSPLPPQVGETSTSEGVVNEDRLDVQESVKVSSGKSTPDQRDTSFLRQYLEKSLFTPMPKNRTISESSCEEIKEIFKNMKKDEIEDFFAPVLPDEARDCDYETVAQSLAKEVVQAPMIDEDEGATSCADTLRDMQSALASEIVDEPCLSSSEVERKEKRFSRYEDSPEKAINFDDFPVLDYLPPMLTEGESLKMFEVSIGVEPAEISADKGAVEGNTTPLVNSDKESAEAEAEPDEDERNEVAGEKETEIDESQPELVVKDEEKLIYGIHTQLRDSIEDSASSSDQVVANLASDVPPTVEVVKPKDGAAGTASPLRTTALTVENQQIVIAAEMQAHDHLTAVLPAEKAVDSLVVSSPVGNTDQKFLTPQSSAEEVAEEAKPTEVAILKDVHEAAKAVTATAVPQEASPLERGTSPIFFDLPEPVNEKMTRKSSFATSASTSTEGDFPEISRRTSMSISTSTSTDQDITSVIQPSVKGHFGKEDDYWEREKAKMKQNLAPKKTMTSTGTSPLPQSIATQTYEDVEIPEVPPPQIRRPSRDEETRSAGYPSPKPRRVNRGMSLDDNPRGAFHYIDPMGYHSGYEIKARSLSREPSPHRGRSETPDRRYPHHPPSFDPWSRNSSSSWDLRTVEDQREWRRGGHWEEAAYPWDYSGYSSGSRYKGSTGSLTSFGTSSSGLISRESRSDATSLFNSYEDVSTSSGSDFQQRRPPDLADLLREAANEGFGPDDVRIALSQCGTSHPIDWLRNNWTTMIDKIVIKATKYGQKQTRNTVGAISRQEAVAALRRQKGNVQMAIQSCIKQRQKKYVHLATKGNFSHEDIVTSLTAAKGDINEALNELLGVASDKDTDSKWSSTDTTTASDVTLKPKRKKSKTREGRRRSMKEQPVLDYEMSDTESLRPGTSMSIASSSIVSSGGTVVPDDTDLPDDDWEDPTTADFDMTSYAAQPEISFRPPSSMAGPVPVRKRHSSGPVSQSVQSDRGPNLQGPIPLSPQVRRSKSRSDRRRSMIDQSMVSQSLAMSDITQPSTTFTQPSTTLSPTAYGNDQRNHTNGQSTFSETLAPSLVSDFGKSSKAFAQPAGEPRKSLNDRSTISEILAPSLVSDFTQSSTMFSQPSARERRKSIHDQSIVSESIAPSLVSDFTQPSITLTQPSASDAGVQRKLLTDQSVISQSLAPSLVSDFSQPSVTFTQSLKTSGNEKSVTMLSESVAPSLVSDFAQESSSLTEPSVNVSRAEGKGKGNRAADALSVDLKSAEAVKEQVTSNKNLQENGTLLSAFPKDGVSVARNQDSTGKGAVQELNNQNKDSLQAATPIQVVSSSSFVPSSRLADNTDKVEDDGQFYTPVEEKELSLSETSDKLTLFEDEDFDYIDDSDDEIMFARDYSPVEFRQTSVGDFSNAPKIPDSRLVVSEPANPSSGSFAPYQAPLTSDNVTGFQALASSQSQGEVKESGNLMEVAKISEQPDGLLTAENNFTTDDKEHVGAIAIPEVTPGASAALQSEGYMEATSPRSSSSSFLSAISVKDTIEDFLDIDLGIRNDRQDSGLEAALPVKLRSKSPRLVDKRKRNSTVALTKEEHKNQIEENKQSSEKYEGGVIVGVNVEVEQNVPEPSQNENVVNVAPEKKPKSSSESSPRQGIEKGAMLEASSTRKQKDASLPRKSSKSPMRDKSPVVKSSSEKSPSTKPMPKANALSPAKVGSRTPSPQARGNTKLALVPSPRVSRSPSGKDSLDVPDYRELSKSPVNDNTDNSAIEDLPDDNDSPAPGLIDYQEAITPEPIPVVIPLYVPTVSMDQVNRALDERGPTQDFGEQEVGKEVVEEIVGLPVEIRVFSSSSQSKTPQNIADVKEDTSEPQVRVVADARSKRSGSKDVSQKSHSGSKNSPSPSRLKDVASEEVSEKVEGKLEAFEGDAVKDPKGTVSQQDALIPHISAGHEDAPSSNTEPRVEEVGDVEASDDVDSESNASMDSQIELSHSVEYDDVGLASQDQSDLGLEPVNPGEFDADGQVEIVSVNEGIGFKRVKTSAAKLLSSRLSRIMTAEVGESFRPSSASPLMEDTSESTGKIPKLSKAEELFQALANAQERKTNEAFLMADLEVALKRTKAVLEEAEHSLREPSPQSDEPLAEGASNGELVAFTARELFQEPGPSTAELMQNSETVEVNGLAEEVQEASKPSRMAAGVEEAVLALEASARKSPPKSPPLRKAERAKDSASLLWRLVEEGRVPNMEKAQLAAHLVDLRFEEDEAVEAALECNSIFSALSYLRQECELCATKYSAKEMVSMLYCVHRCCRSCAGAYFSTQIRDRPLHELVCPFCREPSFSEEKEEDAHEYFMHLEIMLKGLLDVPVFELYERKLRDWTLSKDPNFWWCHKCSSGFFIDPSQSRHICPDCSAVTCAECRKPWRLEHDSMTCAEYIKFLAEEEVESLDTVAKLLAEGIKCPKCSFQYALARGGCMHFTCTQCKFEFCSGCGKPFKMGARCTVGPRCARLGLHAHHPRNCLFYLRDKEPEELQKLLKDSGVHFDVDGPIYDNPNALRRCKVQIQKETPRGFEDDVCGGEIGEGFAGLCRTHYVEYLAGLVARSRVDPLPILDSSELMAELRRACLDPPEREPGEPDRSFYAKVAQVIRQEIPL